MNTTCTNCPRTLVTQGVWNAATPSERTALTASGRGLNQGRGLCRACYQKAWKAGGIPHIRRGVGGRGRVGRGFTRDAHPCDRCGIETRFDTCVDCAAVA